MHPEAYPLVERIATQTGLAIGELIGKSPLIRTLKPEDFADAVVFFMSGLSRAVTGQNLVVDGGLVMN